MARTSSEPRDERRAIVLAWSQIPIGLSSLGAVALGHVLLGIGLFVLFFVVLLVLILFWGDWRIADESATAGRDSDGRFPWYFPVVGAGSSVMAVGVLLGDRPNVALLVPGLVMVACSFVMAFRYFRHHQRQANGRP